MKTKYWIALAIVLLLAVIIWYRRKELKQEVKTIAEKTITKTVDIVSNVTNDKILNQLHPRAQQRFRDFIAAVEKETGHTVIVTSGYRSYAEQASLKKKYPSRAANPGSSHHNFGMAIDVNLQKGLSHYGLAQSKTEWLATGAPAIAKRFNLRWGGDFATNYDPVHFDMGNEFTITFLQKQAAAQFGSNPQDVQGNKVALA
jgi:D-alanyl-D-alanine dipeptidase